MYLSRSYIVGDSDHVHQVFLKDTYATIVHFVLLRIRIVSVLGLSRVASLYI